MPWKGKRVVKTRRTFKCNLTIDGEKLLREIEKRGLTKGRQIGVVGRIQTGSYKDKDGKTVYTTDVIAERIEFLGGEKKEEHHVGGHPYPAPEPRQIGMFEQVNEDLPF